MLFSLIFCNCYIIVFSLVDFKPGGRGFKSLLCQTFFFFFFFTFFSLFLFLNTKRVFWVHISLLPLPPPTFFHFLNIVQYLLVHCIIPSILGSYPTSPPTPNIAFTSTALPTPPPPHLTPSTTDPPPPPPPPPHRTPPPNFFFFEFSQKLQFFVHIHPDPPPNPTPPTDPPPPPRPPPQKIFFLNFYKNFNSSFKSTLTPPPTPPPNRPPPPKKKNFL